MTTLKLGTHVELLVAVETPESGEPLAVGARAHVVCLEPLTVATKSGTVARVERDSFKTSRGRPCRVETAPADEPAEVA